MSNSPVACFYLDLGSTQRGISVMSQSYINVIGAGLAGSEAAYQIAERGIPVKPMKCVVSSQHLSIKQIILQN